MIQKIFIQNEFTASAEMRKRNLLKELKDAYCNDSVVLVAIFRKTHYEILVTKDKKTINSLVHTIQVYYNSDLTSNGKHYSRILGYSIVSSDDKSEIGKAAAQLTEAYMESLQDEKYDVVDS